MNWSEIVSRVAERTGLPKDQVKETLDALAPVVLEAVASGEEAPVRGLCTVGARWQEARALRSVADRRRLMLDGRWVARIRASTGLRDALLQRSPQRWRDPRHQAAWRLAEALVGDLDLYHHARAPQLYDDTPISVVAVQCAAAFGPLWERVVQTWNSQVPSDIRTEGDHLLRVALRRWRAQET